MIEVKLSEELISELAGLGVIFGHKKSKTHPNMKSIIIDNRNEIELMNPEAVVSSLDKTLVFLREKMRSGAVVKTEGEKEVATTNNTLILLVGSLPSARGAIEAFGKEFDFPYVTTRWLGGTLTNFKSIRKRIDHYLGLKDKKEKGELAKYTKKERVGFDKEIEKLEENFSGLIKLTRIPDVLFVVDIKEHETAVREAKHLNVPVIGIVDSDDNPREINYPIYANDHSKQAVEWVVRRLIAGLKEKILKE